MEFQQNPYPYVYRRFPPARDRASAVRWVKEWIPQDLVATGGSCSLFRWVREDMVQTLKDRVSEPLIEEPKPEPTTEVLFLCSYEGCGKTFIDVGALRKHAHIHGERQYVCHYAGCGKKFLDSSKLKRHFLIHTGERDFVCPHEGCGKAFSLDFNLRAHMRTHLAENYHVCPYPECGKRYTNELKLKTHMKSQHEKSTVTEAPKHTPSVTEKPPHCTPKTPTATPSPYVGPGSAERPYACPYKGCEKAYIHEYKLNLHLRREHPNHNQDNNNNNNNNINHNISNSSNNDNNSNSNNNKFSTPKMEEVSDREGYVLKGKSLRRSKPSVITKMPPAKAVKVSNNSSNRKVSGVSSSGKKLWLEREEREGDSEDSEETQEDGENGNGGNGGDMWRYGSEGNGDDEETEDED